jgi:hypothetical protein
MRALRFAMLPLLVGTSLVAQSPTSSPWSAPLTVAPRLAVYLDGAGLGDDRVRAGLEVRIARGWTLGIATSQTGIFRIDGSSWYSVDTSYAASSLELALRSYVVRLPFNRGGNALALYVGAFARHQDHTTRSSRIGAGSGTRRVDPIPDVPLPPDVPPMGILLSPSSTESASGWEPGAEIGLRLVSRGPAFIDLGASFTWVRYDDSALGLRVGNFEPRLVAAVGVGW